MQDHGILHDAKILQDLFNRTIREIMSKKLEGGLTPMKFVDYLDRLDAFPWLTISAGNVILDEVGKRGLVPDMIKFIHHLERRGFKFDTVTLNTILHHCLPNRDHDAMVEVLSHFRRVHRLRPTSVSYDALFQQAWRSRFYNCARVFWRYACLEGFVSYRLKRFVSQSILCDTPQDLSTQATSGGAFWRATVGRVVVGASMGSGSVSTHSAGAVPMPKESLIVPAEIESPPSLVQTDDKELIRNVWTNLFSQDMAVAHCLHAKEPLDELYRRALAIDRQWAHEDVHETKSFRWLWHNTIRVEIKERFPVRFLSEQHPSRDWNRYLREQHPSRYSEPADDDNNCEWRTLVLGDITPNQGTSSHYTSSHDTSSHDT